LLVAIDNGLAKEEHGWAFEDLKKVEDGLYKLQLGT
jgi:hypothetical protein